MLALLVSFIFSNFIAYSSTVYEKELPFRNPHTLRAGSLKLLCSKSIESLENGFREKKLLYRESLVRKGSEFCHVTYQPTRTGFEMHSVQDPIRELHFDLDTLGFVSQVNQKTGRTMDVLQSLIPVLSKRHPEVQVSLGVNSLFDEKELQESLKFYFPHEKDRKNIKLLKRKAHSQIDLADEIWPQDYILSGEINSKDFVLSSYKILMGNPGNRNKFDVFLESLDEKTTIRSNLSFDGGDIHVLDDLKDPTQKIMLYGSSTRDYWGEVLHQGEFEYIMKKELGVDRLYDWGGVAQHLDMFVNFIPEKKIAVVSKYLGKNLSLGCESLSEAIQMLQDEKAILSEPVYQKTCISKQKLSHQEENALKQLLKDLVQKNLKAPEFEAMFVLQATRVFGSECNQKQDCIFERLKKLMSHLPSILEFLKKDDHKIAFQYFYRYFEWLQSASLIREALLNIAKVQILGPSEEFLKRQSGIVKVEKDLKELGYRVLFVPALSDLPEFLGVSYTNFLQVNQTVFFPSLNLKKEEKKIFDPLKKSMKDPNYEFKMIPMRTSLIKNGGVHCRSGIIRTKSNRVGKDKSKE